MFSVELFGGVNINLDIRLNMFLWKRVKSSQINNKSVEDLEICGTRMENNVTKVTGNQTRVNRSFV